MRFPGQSSGALSFFFSNLQLFLHYPLLSLYFFTQQKELYLRSCCCSPSNPEVLSAPCHLTSVTFQNKYFRANNARLCTDVQEKERWQGDCPASPLSLGVLSKCWGRKDVWGMGESCPAALKCLKYPLSSAEGFSSLCHRTLDQPREKKPLLVLPHLVWELHLRRWLMPLLLPQVSCHPPSVLPAWPSCSPQVPPCRRQLPAAPPDLLSWFGSAAWAAIRVQGSSGSRHSSTSPQELTTGCLPGARSAAEKQVRACPILY